MNTTSNVKFFQSSDAVNAFLKSARKYNPLTDEEEKELLERCRKGDQAAKDRIVLSNQLYVFSEAKKYATDEEDLMDYVQIGMMGLIYAFDNYDYDAGVKFLTFARFYIQREMNRYMNEMHDSIQQSNRAKYGKRIEKLKNDFFKTEERWPTYDEILELYTEKYGEEEKIKDIRDVYEMSIKSISLNIDDDYTVEDTADFAIRTASFNDYDVECEHEYDEDNESASIVSMLLSALPTKHAEIMKKYYGIGGPAYSVQELAEEYDMYEKVMQGIIDKCMSYLKENKEDIIAAKTAL